MKDTFFALKKASVLFHAETDTITCKVLENGKPVKKMAALHVAMDLSLHRCNLTCFDIIFLTECNAKNNLRLGKYL